MRGSCWHRFGGGCWMGCSSGRLPMILFGVVAWAWWLGPEHDRSVTQGKAWWRASVCLRVLISSWYCASSVSQHCEALLVKWLGCSHRGRIFRRVWPSCEWAVSDLDRTCEWTLKMWNFGIFSLKSLTGNMFVEEHQLDFLEWVQAHGLVGVLGSLCGGSLIVFLGNVPG
jgi:hypothetical protein